jgi:hypothetical protein
MAAILRVGVASSTQDQFNELDARVGQAMQEAGGPPDGLMSHVVYPEGDGFVVAEVWRDEASGRAYVEDVLLQLVKELGLPLHEIVALPVWSFARP